MRATLFSIQSERLVNVLNEAATILVTKYPLHGWVYLYCTKGKPLARYDAIVQVNGIPVGLDYIYAITNKNDKDAHYFVNGKVVARVYIEKAEKINWVQFNIINKKWRWVSPDMWRYECADMSFLLLKSKLTYVELLKYGNKKPLFANHISKLEIFDKPKELSEFHTTGYEEAMKEIDHIELTGACLNLHEFKPANSALRQLVEDMYRVKIAPQSRRYIDVEGNRYDNRSNFRNSANI